MRTINEATTMALEEKKILDEMERVMKDNEIEPEIDDKGSSHRMFANFVCVFVCILIAFY